MSIKTEDIIEAISKMSIMEVVELVKSIEKKFGVSASPQVVYQNDGNDNKKQEKQEEKTHFNVILNKIGSNKISAIKAVRTVTSLGLKEAKNTVESLPAIIKENADKEEAESIKKKLEESGAVVELK